MRRFLGVLTLTALLLSPACSGSSDDDGPSATAPPTTAPGTTSTTVGPGAAAPAMPRYRRDDPVRLDISSDAPLFIYNIYVGEDSSTVRRVVDLWPEDLRPYLGLQIVFPSKPPLDPTERASRLEAYLDETDAAEIPAIVQTAAFTGATGPNDIEMREAFDRHDSLVGVGIAELSADYASSVGGLSAVQKDLVATQIESAVANRALFLWADMGYFGPQVFVDAGADPRLAALLRDHHQHIVIQAKQNGAGRHFGTMSAALGLAAAGFADNWGVNSEDWLWWESSFERIGQPQLPGGLTAAGMTRSPRANLSRLTYPEALFGTEMLVAAASGATVYSIEAPARGTVDPTHESVSPAGSEVVFPLLRRLVADRLIPSQESMAGRMPVAVRPVDRDAPLLATDTVFSALYGPDGCTDDDRISCSQRQWLPSTGRYGIVPTVPALATDEDLAGFDEVIDLGAATSAAAVREVAQSALADLGTGTAWTAASGRRDTWFVATTEENVATPMEFDLGTVTGELGPQSFAVVRTGNDARTVFVDNFRTDTSALWDTDRPDEELGAVDLRSIPVAPPATTVVRFALGGLGDEPTATVEGASDSSQQVQGDDLVVTVTHRGPVTVSVDLA